MPSDPPKVPLALQSAITATTAAIGKIRAEQGRRGPKPSGEIQLAMRKAQEARFWLRVAAGLEDE